MHGGIQVQKLVGSQIGVSRGLPSLKYCGGTQRRLVVLKKVVEFGALPDSKTMLIAVILEVKSPQSTALIVTK